VLPRDRTCFWIMRGQGTPSGSLAAGRRGSGRGPPGGRTDGGPSRYIQEYDWLRAVLDEEGHWRALSTVAVCGSSQDLGKGTRDHYPSPRRHPIHPSIPSICGRSTAGSCCQYLSYDAIGQHCLFAELLIGDLAKRFLHLQESRCHSIASPPECWQRSAASQLSRHPSRLQYQYHIRWRASRSARAPPSPQGRRG